ncbi:MAG: trypsin-like peptidase domain-containing protein [Lutisporaceae bacterium]
MFKKLTKGLSFLFAMLLTFSLPVYAIGFDAETVFKSVVIVYSGNSFGSGFAVGSNYIITNAHVIEDEENIEISTYKDKKYSVELVSMDSYADLAVLKVSNKTLPYLKLADYNDLSIGTDVYAVGIPKDMAYTLTKGILSAKDRVLAGNNYIQTDAPINSGNSGGPLLNENGEVIGVNTLKIIDSEGIGLAIPMTTVASFLQANNINITEQSDVISDLAVKSEYKEENKGKQSYIEAYPEKQQIIKLKNQVFYFRIAVISLVILQLVTLGILLAILNKRKQESFKMKDPYDFDIEIQE